MSLSLKDAKSILESVETATENFGLCRNRVWAIAKSLRGGPSEFPKLIPPGKTPSHTIKSENHELCTFDFCEQSRMNFTLVEQRHECPDPPKCKAQRFPTELVADAIRKEQPTAWNFEGTETLKTDERYIAISHVWSDGTGAGNQAPGHVNKCLIELFRGFAEKFGSKGIWWDTICIPTSKALREKALKGMQENYQTAAVTLVHDCFLRDCEWRDADSACFDIMVSPWFSRGWTALELKMSQNVKVIFKGPSASGLITKDLDEDILNATSNEHSIAKRLLKKLRGGERVSQLNDLLAILGSRHTSWPRDMAIISALMMGIELPDDFTHQTIYQEILQNTNGISHAHLFHNSATMAKGYNWCPTTIYELPVSSQNGTLEIERNGTLFGKWDIMSLDLIDDEKFSPGRAHQLIDAKVHLARKEKDQHFLLIEPELAPGETIDRAIVVRPLIVREQGSIDCYCDYVGPAYFHPPLKKAEIKKRGQIVPFNNVHIGFDESVFNNSHESTDREQSARCILTDLKHHGGFPDTQPKKRQVELKLNSRDESKIRIELMKAIGVDDEKKVETLLRELPEKHWNNTDKRTGHSALHHAVWIDKRKVTKLLARMLDVRKRTNKSGEEPLHLAVERGNKELVSILLKGSTPNLKRDDGLTALHLAAKGGHTEIVTELVQIGWDPNTTNDVQGQTALIIASNTTSDVRGQTALHIASENGFHNTVAALLNSNADPSLEDQMKETAFSLAVFNGHKETAKLLGGKLSTLSSYDLLARAVMLKDDKYIIILHDCGANIEAKDESGETPLHLAARWHKGGSIRALHKLGANLEAQDDVGNTALHKALFDGKDVSIRALCKLGANLEAQDHTGATPLHKAVQLGGIPVETLCKLGANVEAQDHMGETPLHRAVLWTESSKIINLLYEYGANLEARTKSFSETPLHKAVYCRNDDSIRALHKLGVNLEAQDHSGATPLHEAAHCGNDDSIRVLHKLGANLEARDHSGMTPLHKAVRSGKDGSIRVLHKLGANLEAQDHSGATPLHKAVSEGEESCIETLHKLGAKKPATN
ncbi:hypothetical protein PENSOL_c008G07737 [Penicillium solitum]|uniref:Uncharacterized protein n=1 Tax=Penicillium solitum TaxID=60172 RepID=A0A1V6RB81_9EURO|nr:uncharacterized protein PENSOL_c008G07737 [Penicillium solitum]OQD98790.1 hypothetical protein PENSOL_c008G07737 [Penicillium solitum]